MKKRLNGLLTFPLFITAIFLISCSGNDRSETIDIATVNATSDKGENIRIGNDLCTFDFKSLIAEKMVESNSQILEGMQWQCNTPAEDEEVIFQLKLKGAALAQKENIVRITKTFVDKTLAEYHKTMPKMDEVEVAAEYYMHLIETSTIDTIWLKTSPTLLKFASKDDFNSSLKQRKVLFKPMGSRKVENRRVSGDLGPDIKGNFYTVIFVYENNDHEEVTLEKIGETYKLLGYRFYVKK